MSTTVEHRHTSAAGSLRASQQSHGGPKIGGLAIPYGVMSDDLGGFTERIARGAFTQSIKNDDVRALFNHDSNYVLGRKSAGTLRLTEGKRGVEFEVDAPDTTWARDLAESIRRGDIRENSFAFQVPKGGDVWTETATGLKRTVIKAQLREIGPQPFPAYPQSEVHIRSIRATLERGRACVGPFCATSQQNPNAARAEHEHERDRIRLAQLGTPPVKRERTQDRDAARDEHERERQKLEAIATGVPREAKPVTRRQRPREYPSEWEFRRLLENSSHEVRALAYHEAAHAVASVLAGIKLDSVHLYSKRTGDGRWRINGGACRWRDCRSGDGRISPAIYMAGQAGEVLAGFDRPRRSKVSTDE